MTAIRTRAEWGAKVNLSPRLMRLPVKGVYLHHSATSTGLDPDEDIREVESIGKARFGIMSYSWLVHPEAPGVVFEGAGLTRGAHTEKKNSTNFGINFVGNYDLQDPVSTQVEDVVWIIRHLISENLLVENYHLGYHGQVKQTACPGAGVIRILEYIRNKTRVPVAKPNSPVATLPPDTKLPILGFGMRSQHVAILQQLLNVKAGQELTVDGHFGPRTAQAVVNVKRFFFGQGDYDSTVGPQTWAILLSI